MATNNKNYRELSKHDFVPSIADRDDIQIGCLQRIADASEVMAQNYGLIIKAKTQAESDRDKYLKWWREEQAKVNQRDRQISALKGVITRMKNKEAK
jgi:hypothetical protein